MRTRRLAAAGLIFFVLTVVSLSVYLHSHQETMEPVSFSRSEDPLNGYGLWTIRDGQRTLKQLVILEEGSGRHTAFQTNFPWAWPRQKPEVNAAATVHVDAIPRGIFLNGVALPATEERRVFIRQRDGSLTPLPLSLAELGQFTPEFIREELKSTLLWKERILPLVDPSEIETQRKLAARALEGREQAEMKANGIELVHGVYMRRGLYCYSDWLAYPDGTSVFQNAFVTRHEPFGYTRPQSDFAQRFVPGRDHPRPAGSVRVILETFPTHFEINGKVVKRGQVYIQRPNGTIRVLALMPAERLQVTRALFASEAFDASDLFIQKIGPLIGPPIPEPAAKGTATP